MPERKVSTVCPSCGHAESKAIRSKKWIAFRDDRKCLACQTRYTLPTPRWAGMLFIAIGGLLVLVGLTFIVIALFAFAMSGRPDVCGMVLSGGAIFVGVMSIRHGILSLADSGQV